MCIFNHRFQISFCDGREKIIKEKNSFVTGYKTFWKCKDCNKEIFYFVEKGGHGFLLLSVYLKNVYKHTMTE